MKKIILLVVISFSILFSACSSIDQGQQTLSQIPESPGQGNVENVQNRNSNNNQVKGQTGNSQHESSSDLHGSGISSSETESIKFMMEEEKLARDVYLYLDGLWNMNIFSNIARSEQVHMDAVMGLIDKHDIKDPSAGTEMGEFTNQELQALYDMLVEKGSRDLEDAILIGGAIEEIDILDLLAYLETATDSAVVGVYQNLLQGSINHLAAFARTYERQTGESYQPQYLSQEVYESLFSQSPAERNGQRGQGKIGNSQGNRSSH